MKQVYNLGLMLSFVLSLVACGGGGGGGGSSSNSSSISYTGSSAAANLDSSNSNQVAGSTATSGAVGSTAGAVAAVDSNAVPSKSGTSIISQAAVKAVEHKLNSTDPATGLTATVSSNTIAGSCGGSQTFSINVDSTTRTFSGSMSFTNYCETDTTISGNATISGSVNASATSITLNLTFNSLLIQDKVTNKVYKLENYVIAIVSNSSATAYSISMNGKFYHPQYGYVLVTTIAPFQYSSASTWPSSGKIKITEDGAAPVDSATLTALNTTQYQVDVDNGNDGSIDSSTLGNWADL